MFDSFDEGQGILSVTPYVGIFDPVCILCFQRRKLVPRYILACMKALGTTPLLLKLKLPPTYGLCANGSREISGVDIPRSF